MIRLAGAVQRSFTFPGRVPEACAFFGDFERLLPYLPHIRPVETYAPDQFRLLYHTTELGLYTVRLYCDVQVTINPERTRLTVAPLPGHAPVAPRATLRSLVAQGCFASESRFMPAGRRTRVDYALQLSADLPKAVSLSLVPDAVVEHIAAEIAARRIAEIADGFIRNSSRGYAAQSRTGAQL